MRRQILFIDELHTIVGAGLGGGEGSSMDAANILKPALARGTLRCMGATTLDEFRRCTHSSMACFDSSVKCFLWVFVFHCLCLCGSCIEKDPALARRFQAVAVDEPSEQQTLRILRALQPKYEAFHRIRFEDEALQAAVRLANRCENSDFHIVILPS